MAMEFLGFSFCLIYPGLGSGEASKAGKSIGADQKKKKKRKSLRKAYSLSNQKARKGAV